MSRPLPVDCAGQIYHALNRGNARNDIFFKAGDDESAAWLLKRRQRNVLAIPSPCSDRRRRVVAGATLHEPVPLLAESVLAIPAAFVLRQGSVIRCRPAAGFPQTADAPIRRRREFA